VTAVKRSNVVPLSTARERRVSSAGAAEPSADTPGVRRRRTMDDAELGEAVARSRNGDELAFAAVYQEVHPMLLGYLRGLVGDDADDVASETWHDIVRDLNGFRGDGMRFRGWTATIARHRAIDHIRRIKVRPRTSVLNEQAVASAAVRDSESLALENLTTEHALSLVARLPPDQAEAVLLRVVLGLDGPMAAKVLRKRPGAVRTASHRGLKRLSEYLSAAKEK
jgi:RNA polymerase sigma factor (sigma-70 family)